ncbi:hypothetical protein E2J97_04365 [Vibrio cholerae]|uniref:hypothetical protein n=1 Tax=Vibrio cholerae TaxID=666 RepID=UPI003D34C263|nr:hypothetical protein [Vibrio cholerae]
MGLSEEMRQAKIEIQQKLSKKIIQKLGDAYDFGEYNNELYFIFYQKYKKVINDYDLDFIVTKNSYPTAAIDYETKAIIITDGLLDRLFKLSELIVYSGVLDNEKVELRYYDIHFTDNPFRYINEKENISTTKKGLFHFVFNMLMNFVIHHEVAHFMNEHGKRFGNNKHGDISDNLLFLEGYTELSCEDENEIIASHARELIADYISFRVLLKTEIKSPEKIGLNKFYSNPNNMTMLILLIISSYFRVMDVFFNSKFFNNTHPTSVIRAYAIWSKYCAEDSLIQPIKLAEIFYSLDEVRKVFDYYGQPIPENWLEEALSEDASCWIKKVSNDYKNWLK